MTKYGGKYTILQILQLKILKTRSYVADTLLPTNFPCLDGALELQTAFKQVQPNRVAYARRGLFDFCYGTPLRVAFTYETGKKHQ